MLVFAGFHRFAHIRDTHHRENAVRKGRVLLYAAVERNGCKVVEFPHIHRIKLTAVDVSIVPVPARAINLRGSLVSNTS